jgi:hypothetical protein
MVPIEDASEGSPEAVYNKFQEKTRSTIDRTFGILKGRWRCLSAVRELFYKPEKAGEIIIACAILHNMCIDEGLEDQPLNKDELQEEATRQPVIESPNLSTAESLQGRRVRQNLINLLNKIKQ